MKILGKYALVNGKIIPTEEAKIHVFDLGLMRGMAVFDFLRFQNFKPFFLKEHVDRIFSSAAVFNIPTVYTKKQYENFIKELIQKNNQDKGSIRIIISAGPVTNGFEITAPHVIILIEPYYELPKECFEKGVKIITDVYDRPYPRTKHTHYLEAGRLEQKRQNEKAVEILYIDSKGFVREFSTSNICMIKSNVLYTPKSNILAGITLKYVLECAKKLGIKYVINDFKLNNLLKADEVFLTATNKDVLPIVTIDRHTIANGMPGEITKNILECYRKLIHK